MLTLFNCIKQYLAQENYADSGQLLFVKIFLKTDRLLPIPW